MINHHAVIAYSFFLPEAEAATDHHRRSLRPLTDKTQKQQLQLRSDATATAPATGCSGHQAAYASAMCSSTPTPRGWNTEYLLLRNRRARVPDQTHDEDHHLDPDSFMNQKHRRRWPHKPHVMIRAEPGRARPEKVKVRDSPRRPGHSEHSRG